jgi:tetratricopeptide (TPR) repeat protein
MMRTCFVAKAAFVVALGILAVPAPPASAQDQSSQQPPYTIPEYNAYQAARSETNAQNRVKLLDDFVAKFPNSTLLPYIYQLYFSTYGELKDYPNVIKSADKLLSLPKVDDGTKLQALQARVQAFQASFDPKAADAHDQLTKERDAAKQGATLLAAYPKPANATMSDEDFAKQKKPGIAFFDAAAGYAELLLKDYAGAITDYKAAVENDPNPQTAGISWYRLGVSYLEVQPPQNIDGFWAIARAINMKVPGMEDAKLKDYLKKSIMSYEQPNCDSIVDTQLAELLQLAGTSGDRPATYTIPSAADLQKAASGSTILTVITDLQAGGDKAKLTWIAICGAEFPQVGGKIFDVTPAADSVEMHIYTGATAEDITNATTPNLDVKFVGQPEVSRFKKDDEIVFDGTLVGYDPTPFMLHFDKAKVDPKIIPAENAPAGHKKTTK